MEAGDKRNETKGKEKDRAMSEGWMDGGMRVNMGRK